MTLDLRISIICVLLPYKWHASKSQDYKLELSFDQYLHRNSTKKWLRQIQNCIEFVFIRCVYLFLNVFDEYFRTYCGCQSDEKYE